MHADPEPAAPPQDEERGDDLESSDTEAPLVIEDVLLDDLGLGALGRIY